MIIDLPTKRIWALSQWQTFLRVLRTRWRQKSTGIDMEQNYVTVTLRLDYFLFVRHARRRTSYMVENIIYIKTVRFAVGLPERLTKWAVSFQLLRYKKNYNSRWLIYLTKSSVDLRTVLSGINRLYSWPMYLEANSSSSCFSACCTAFTNVEK